MPTAPQPDVGRIWRLGYHGKYVYLTRSEDVLLKALLASAAVAFAAAVAIDIRFHPFRQAP